MNLVFNGFLFVHASTSCPSRPTTAFTAWAIGAAARVPRTTRIVRTGDHRQPFSPRSCVRPAA
jgi:hypothetical protein